MQRNFDRCVEIAFPVLDPVLQNRLKQVLETQLAEDIKGWWMKSDGSYHRQKATDSLAVRSQESSMSGSSTGRRTPRLEENNLAGASLMW